MKRRWNKPGIPHTDWIHIEVEELEEADFTCEMCDQEEIRYVHHLVHENYGDIAVGCVCAESMCSDEVNPRRMENQRKSQARARRLRLRKAEETNLKLEAQEAERKGRLAQAGADRVAHLAKLKRDAEERANVARALPPLHESYASFGRPEPSYGGPVVWISTEYAVVGRRLRVRSKSGRMSLVEILSCGNSWDGAVTKAYCKWVNPEPVKAAPFREFVLTEAELDALLA